MLHYLKTILAITLILFLSCKKTNNAKDASLDKKYIKKTNTIDTLKSSELIGSFNKHIVLSPKINYQLTGSLYVEKNGTLTIPSGTTITASNKNAYIAILRGAKIYIKGTKNKPVVIKGIGSSGSWGGLIICGDAKTNSKPNAKSELEKVVYGGINNDDDSGSISYLILKDGGSAITEFVNHSCLALNAVGKNTKLNNIAILNSADDGLAIVGGNVSLENIYLKNNTDDALDWDDGWSGTINNSIIEYDENFHFSSAIEGSYESLPKLKNVFISAPKNKFKNLKNDLNKRIAFNLKNHAKFEAEQLTLKNFDVKFKVKNTTFLTKMDNINGKPANENFKYNTSTINKTYFNWVK